MHWLWKSLIALAVLAAIGIGAILFSVDRYHKSGPPAQERLARERAIQPLVQSHATRDQVVQALGAQFYSVGSTERPSLQELSLSFEPVRCRAEQYPGVLFYSRGLTMTWLFFDADARLQDYYVCEN